MTFENSRHINIAFFLSRVNRKRFNGKEYGKVDRQLRFVSRSNASRYHH